jgi:nucleoside-diphosphate-sugar epimerase
MSNPPSKPLIFITGGTGLIGGTFLHLMLQRDYLRDFTISALVRRPEDAEKMRELGVTPILGTLDDNDVLTREAARASVVFNTADCDHQESVKSIIRGLSQRSTQAGARPILIHTSGAGVLSTNSIGAGAPLEGDPTAAEWDEADVAAHTAIPRHAPHRLVDIEVFEAARSGLLKTYLVVPPTVFGRGLGPFAAQRMSIQIPRLVYQSLLHRQALFVGTGENVWPNVHVADLAELYLLILTGALKDTAPKGEAGLYYPASEHFVWSTVSHQIGKVLHARGLIQNPVATTGLQRGWFWGSNVRVKCTNSERLGWVPRSGGTGEMLENIEWDATLMLSWLASNT